MGRYSGKGDAAVIVEGSVNGAARKFTYEVNFPEEASANEFIPRLWATRRVGYLLDEIRLHGENAELRDEVTELARKYSIVTPYTAYLILEDETQRNVPMAMRSLQGFDGDGGARTRGGAGLEQLQRQSAAVTQPWRVPAMAWPSNPRMRPRPQPSTAPSKLAGRSGLSDAGKLRHRAILGRPQQRPSRSICAAVAVRCRQELFPERQAMD